jgi:Asp-tRNA(Asn)/Glu-tRNA(Gln) amidotransferase A subunit family amidase
MFEEFLSTVFSKSTPGLSENGRGANPTRVINFLGLPALSVTCSHTSEGMRTSFQLVSRPFSESLLFRLGHCFHEETSLHRAVPSAIKKSTAAEPLQTL